MAFFQQRDFDFFQSINRELIDDFVETPVIIYKVDEKNTEKNLYGESVSGKSYQVGFQINALIARNDQTVEYDDFGSNSQQGIQFRFLRETLSDVSFKPWFGDIIQFNDAFFQIDNVIDNQLIAGNVDFSNSIIVDTHMTRRSKLNIDKLY